MRWLYIERGKGNTTTVLVEKEASNVTKLTKVERESSEIVVNVTRHRRTISTAKQIKGKWSSVRAFPSLKLLGEKKNKSLLGIRCSWKVKRKPFETKDASGSRMDPSFLARCSTQILISNKRHSSRMSRVLELSSRHVFFLRKNSCNCKPRSTDVIARVEKCDFLQLEIRVSSQFAFKNSYVAAFSNRVEG